MAACADGRGGGRKKHRRAGAAVPTGHAGESVFCPATGIFRPGLSAACGISCPLAWSSNAILAKKSLLFMFFAIRVTKPLRIGTIRY